LKLNYDCAFLNDRHLATGMSVIRYENGSIDQAFSRRLGHMSILEAKLWGLTWGLHKVASSNCLLVEKESDSLVGVNFINNGCPNSHSCFD